MPETRNPIMRLSVFLLPMAIIGLMAMATENPSATPVGLWKTISDTDGKPRGLIEITERNGTYSGAVVRSLAAEDEDNAVCDACPGDRKGQPIKGLVILTGLRKKNSQEYGGGQLLDPDSGNIYDCNIRLRDNGNTLIVRGFIGFSLFGRSQTWERADPVRHNGN